MFSNLFDFLEDLSDDFLGGIFDKDKDNAEEQTQADNLVEPVETESYLVDLDGDGAVDSLATDSVFDTDGDGLLDTVITEIQMDLDGDGTLEVASVITQEDTDGDGIIDTSSEVMDFDGDGIIDYGYITVGKDTDGDGVIDLIQLGEDFDGDGILDSFTEEHVSDDDADVPDGNPQVDGLVEYEHFDPSDSNDPGVVGDPGEAMENWHCQETNTSCAVAAQEFILETLTGKEFTEAELRDLAEYFGWYDPNGGTPMDDVGNILEYMGLTVHKSQGNDISDIEECLENGGEVVVGVDSGEIWYGEDDDFFGPGQGADHAIHVIGIDRSNPDEPMVIINDSGTPDGCGMMVPLDVFMDAWEDSGCFMVEAYE